MTEICLMHQNIVFYWGVETHYLTAQIYASHSKRATAKLLALTFSSAFSSVVLASP